MECVVYRIKNKINEKVYIGSTLGKFSTRIYNHKNALKNNKHCNKHLQSSWNVYGCKIFEFDIIEKVMDKSILLEREQYWMNYYKSYNGELLPEMWNRKNFCSK